MKTQAKQIIFLVLISSLPLILGFVSNDEQKNLNIQKGTSPIQNNSPGVFLNHLYIVLDTTTYKAIKESEFIKEMFYGLFETPGSNEKFSYNGGYLFGKSTYIELFTPQGLKGANEGSVGIGLSTHKTGDIDIVYDKFKSKFGEQSVKGLRKMKAGDTEYPWFNYVSSAPEDNEKPFSVWVMEFHPAHLQFSGALPDSNGVISREAYLDAGRKKLTEATGKQLPPILFRDFESVALSLTREEAEQLSTELSLIGYEKKDEKDATIFTGPKIIIRISVTDKPGYRISSFRIKFAGQLGEIREIQLSSNLKISVDSDSTTTWYFRQNFR